MEDIKSSIESLQVDFHKRMAAFEDELKKEPATRVDATNTISKDFMHFRGFIVSALNTLQVQVELLAAEMDHMEMRSRRKMLLLHGVPEHKEEDAVATVVDVAHKHLPSSSLQPGHIRQAHRMGRRPGPGDKPRPLLVKFADRTLRDEVWANKTGLKGSGVTLSEFLTRRRHKLFKAARQKLGVSKCWTQGGRITAIGPDDKRCFISSMQDLEKLGGSRSSVTSESEDVSAGGSPQPATVVESPSVAGDAVKAKGSYAKASGARQPPAAPAKRTRATTAAKKRKAHTSTALILLLHLSLHTVDEGHAINPSCTCIRFTSTYGKERGTFSSPDYPRPYPARLDCLLYTFLAAPHEIVELVFTDFDIYKGHLECIHGDYLKVYSEGGIHGPGPPPEINEYSAWTRVLCGGRVDAPPAVYSHGPLLVLEFHVGAKVTNATGFVGTFRFIDRRNFETDGVKVPETWCDYVFNSQPNRPAHGKLYSPRYPSSYPSNVRCTYHFNARQHERIKLVFEESFLQKGDESCLNRADIIKVFDGRSLTAPVLAMLCNEVVGYEILSTGADLLVQFTANSNTPGQGFKASYQFEMEDNSSADPEINKKASEAISGLGPAVSAATSSCHQVFRSDKSKSGKLVSPLYPAPYTPKTQCHYDFLARGRERVRLIFEDFSLQRTTGDIIDCESMDSLDVFLYVDGRLEKMASYCGNEIPKPIMSNGPKLSIEFRGLFSSRQSRGFKLSYSFVEDYGIATGNQLLEFPCAFVYNSSEGSKGVVTSPNHPGLYPRDTECNYFFYGNDNERVHLRFSHFDVEGVVPCEVVSASDYVQFSSQIVQTDSHRYCGQIRELEITSIKNFLRITFKSNDRLDGTGFKADYIFLRESEMHSITMPDSVDSGSRRNFKMFRILFYVFLTIVQIINRRA